MSRLTTGWKIAGTKPFRLASAKLFWHFGTNLQNPSHSLMRCIIPDEGKVFLQADQSGADAKVVAYECRPGKFRDLFIAGIKPHTYMALMIFIDRFRGSHPRERYETPAPSDLKKLPEWKTLSDTIKYSGDPYALGKMTIHAKNYDMKGPTFQTNCLDKSDGAIRLSIKQANDYLSRHEEIFPEIIEWQAHIRDEIHRCRTLRNHFGFPRYFAGKMSSELYRDAYSWIPASTVGTITNIAITQYQQAIESQKLPHDVLNNKHDSMLVQVPDNPEHIELSVQLLKTYLAKDLVSSKGEPYKMGVEVAKGYNWDKYDKVSNPEGMQDYA
jgi:hypothetical protein